MDKRYQIFVSSTFEDLKEERKKIIEEILNFSHIPIGMENFTASNDEQFEYIKKILQTCDYYVLVVGGRYGSVNPVTGISYTEQEYNYALELGLPVLAFVHENPLDLPHNKRDDHNRELFTTFLEHVKTGRMVKYWSNTDRLIADVIIGLNHAFNNNPQLGWVRGGENNSPELLKQINDLRLEKEAIQKKYDELKEKYTNPLVEIENLAEMDELFQVTGTTIIFDDDERFEVNNFEGYSWNQIFSRVGPYLYSSCNYDQFDTAVHKAFSNFHSIESNCVQIIKIQLMAYGLIEIYNDTLTSGRSHEFIVLSDKGKEQLLKIKTVKSNKEDSLV